MRFCAGRDETGGTRNQHAWIDDLAVNGLQKPEVGLVRKPSGKRGSVHPDKSSPATNSVGKHSTTLQHQARQPDYPLPIAKNQALNG